jgi:2-polyprenyl-3-methyl-5-hydroxy-6-metoxy-1,4-benzoquinol methylase
MSEDRFGETAKMDYKDRQAGVTQEYFTNRAQLFLIDAMLSKIRLQPGSKILSVGCGDGNELKVLSRYGTVDILDTDKKAISLIPKSSYSQAHLKSILDFSPKEKYDLVVAFDVLEHIEDDRKAIEKICSSLKPGGYLIFTVPAHQSLYSAHDKALGHARRYSKRRLKSILSGLFSLRFLSYRYFFISPAVVASKLMNRNSKPHIEAPRLPKSINSLMLFVLRLEISLMKKGIALPFGISLVGICRRK